MDTNVIAFWEMNVNSITMREKDNELRMSQPKIITPKTSLDDDFMIISDCREYLGIGARKIKAYGLKIGEKSIDSKIGVMYRKSTIDKIKEMIQSDKQNKLKMKI